MMQVGLTHDGKLCVAAPGKDGAIVELELAEGSAEPLLRRLLAQQRYDADVGQKAGPTLRAIWEILRSLAPPAQRAGPSAKELDGAKVPYTLEEIL